MFLLAACVPVSKEAPVESADTLPAETDAHSDTAPGETETAEETAVETEESAETEDTRETAHTAETGVEAPPPPALILFIGDGLGAEHIAGAGYYRAGAEGSLVMETLPYQGHLRTASLTGVTDSAAGATTMAAGIKTNNGALGMSSDGVPVETIVERARARGMAAGVVTTDELVGATPAAFVVHTEDRRDASTIAAEWGANFPELALGGGELSMSVLMADTATYQVVTTRDELLAATPDGRPLLGVFSPEELPYYADGLTTEPRLAEMTSAALAWLESDPEGFLLVVEGARIDHASHAMDGSRVFQEVTEFDDAVARALAWASKRENTTILVAADHECGGLHLTGTASAGSLPPVEWRWGSHTNADIRLLGYGDAVASLDGERWSNQWVYSLLVAAMDDAAVVPPTEPPVVDGYLEDLGSAVVTQTWKTSFGEGFNQLDGLRLDADEDGLRVGVDGVFEDDGNAVAVFVDLDYGAGTGFLGDVPTLADYAGSGDLALSSLSLSTVEGAGFDVAFFTAAAEETALGTPGSDLMGLRGFDGDWGSPTNFAWLESIANFDDGNLSLWDEPAPDAGSPGATTGGLEVLLPWSTLFPAGLPAAGLDVAVAVVLFNSDGSWLSNQALPPYADSAEPGEGTGALEQLGALSVDGSGLPLGAATLVP